MKVLLNYAKYALLIIAAGVFAIGNILEHFNVILLGVIFLFLSNMISGCLQWKTHVIFVFFHITLFTFLLSRPLISVFRRYTWWSFGDQAAKFAMMAIFLSMFAMRLGAKIVVYLKGKKTAAEVEPIRGDCDRAGFLYSLRVVSFLFFAVTMFFFLITEVEKLMFMSDRSYEEYYLYFEPGLPTPVYILAEMMKYALCIYLATLPKKRISFCVLALYVFSAIPSLLIGIRNPIVLNMIFAVLYYLIRDILENDRRWFSKVEIVAVVIALPLGILFLSAYNYIRDDLAVEMSVAESISDFFFKQGVTFDTINKGYNAISELPSVVSKNYTFGKFVDYLTRGSIGQFLFETVPIGNNNSEIVAVYGNSLAHSLSYVVHPGYLEGHGVGTSYLLENYVDWGYIGVVGFSLCLGAAMSLMSIGFRKGPLIRTIILVSLTQLFFIPRAEATGWIAFVIYMPFWLAVGFCMICAYVISDKSQLNFNKKLALKRSRNYA